jgi:signal transduction histidine kinase
MNATGAALLAQTVANRSFRQLVATPVTLILAGLLLVGALVAVAFLSQYGVERFAIGSEALLPWVWAGFGLFWLTLALWLRDAMNSARRLAQAVHERQLAIQSMQRAVGTQLVFLRMVDYELRSPLQIIVTSAESLAHDLAPAQTRPQTATSIRRIQHAVAAVQFRLRDLHTLARSEANTSNQPGQANMAGAASDVRQIFDAAEWLHDICAELAEAAQAKGLKLKIDAPRSPQMVHADSIRLSQVLRNLLHNAVRHTASGRIEVTLHSLDLSQNASSRSALLRFTVSDTGPGVPADALARLSPGSIAHDLFPDNAPTSPPIGLLVIRNVLQQLGGTAQVTTHADQGTSIQVSVPVSLPT